jgi:hypothetical protein
MAALKKKGRYMKKTKLFSVLISMFTIFILALPLPAGALTVDNYVLFGGSFINMNGSNTITGNVYSGNDLNFNSNLTGNALVHGNFNGNGGSVTGNVDALHAINQNSVTISGTKTANDSTVPLLTLDANSTILAGLAGLGTITTFSGNHTFTSSDPAGIYHVTGDVNFASGAHGNWTIVGDSNINGNSNVQVTSFISAGGLFPNGLALYDASGFINNLGGIFSGAVAGGNVENFNGANISGGVAAAVPEPSTLMLLGCGLIGLAAWRRRKTA